MKSSLTIVLGVMGAVLLYGAYCVLTFVSAAKKSAPLIALTPGFSREDAALQKSMLVLGDSLAVGVGAKPEESVAGRLAHALNSNSASFAKSGVLTRDIAAQMKAAQKHRYDVVLIQAGANDIISLKSLVEAEKSMDNALQEARKKSDHVVLFIAGDVGAAPLWPWPFDRWYSRKTKELGSRFKTLAEKHGALYVDIGARGDLFAANPDAYYASDQLHLTALGYEKWFQIVKEEMQKTWPHLV